MDRAEIVLTVARTPVTDEADCEIHSAGPFSARGWRLRSRAPHTWKREAQGTSGTGVGAKQPSLQ